MQKKQTWILKSKTCVSLNSSWGSLTLCAPCISLWWLFPQFRRIAPSYGLTQKFIFKERCNANSQEWHSCLTVSFYTELAKANLAPPALIFTGQIQEVKTSSNSSYTRFCSPCHLHPTFIMWIQSSFFKQSFNIYDTILRIFWSAISQTLKPYQSCLCSRCHAATSDTYSKDKSNTES